MQTMIGHADDDWTRMLRPRSAKTRVQSARTTRVLYAPAEENSFSSSLHFFSNIFLTSSPIGALLPYESSAYAILSRPGGYLTASETMTYHAKAETSDEQRSETSPTANPRPRPTMKRRKQATNDDNFNESSETTIISDVQADGHKVDYITDQCDDIVPVQHRRK